MIKVAIAGPRGRMGQEAVHTIMKHDKMELVAVLDHREIARNLADYELFPTTYNVAVFTDLKTLFEATTPHVIIDLTTPETVYKHTKLSLEYGVRPVIGTTGFTDEQLLELTNYAKEHRIGAIIAPNFAVGAVLMMKFAAMAAQYMPDVEIIELHHDQKLDAPSGTALKTAQLIQENRPSHKQGHPDEKETLAGARGADFDGMRIHSVRLQGLVAHQEVLFGGEGQMLTIRHDSYNRGSFMSGVKLCVEKVVDMEELVYGLENIL
ncbi:4-hydroxy-tetrahydrodipicolinate reductase [Kurthia sibirica]|uniref:4-hydroxy-tetrahydrodipicolinate reductase n=1 Tax=Kurthia sibirica TaxID=202750 RepID=A0A2U3AI67_9BACL|nr:4-hydroxy-tetrahydrodipicolinate reductase [Kurthia sibirica]PWI24243.1 4-hydroxy-tetrahydrodipicolinate reductase [Kurthia sibirica]GEK34142.1 4-hydroxy-tetrahydrodipicolinate reductase [Kurthia sibirica]